MNKLVIVSYLNFLGLSEKARHLLSENDSFLVSVSAEEYAKLSTEDKKKLIGVALTDEKHNAQIIEKSEPEPKALFPQDFPELIDGKKMVQTYRQKHLKNSRPYAPRKIINPLYNSKKKSTRWAFPCHAEELQPFLCHAEGL